DSSVTGVQTCALPISHTISINPTLTHKHTHTHTPFLFLSLSLFLSHKHTHTYTHTYTHQFSHRLKPTVSLPACERCGFSLSLSIPSTGSDIYWCPHRCRGSAIPMYTCNLTER